MIEQKSNKTNDKSNKTNERTREHTRSYFLDIWCIVLVWNERKNEIEFREPAATPLALVFVFDSVNIDDRCCAFKPTDRAADGDPSNENDFALVTNCFNCLLIAWELIARADLFLIFFVTNYEQKWNGVEEIYERVSMDAAASAETAERERNRDHADDNF